MLHLKCGVSVSKRNDSECAWVEEAEFKDVSDKTFGDFFIAPRISSSRPIASSPCPDTSKIKRELDETIPSDVHEISRLPLNSQIYLEKARPLIADNSHKISNSNVTNLSVDKQPRAELTNDSISDDKRDNDNQNKLIVEDSLTQNLPSLPIEEDCISENIRVLGEEDFEDSEPVLVRPVPADLPEDSAPKRTPSFDGTLK